jgi:hypothetical protein
MRHLFLAVEVALLTGCVVRFPVLGGLISTAGSLEAVAPGVVGAAGEAVSIPAVTSGAEADLSSTSLAVVEAVSDDVGVDRATSTGENECGLEQV